MLSVKSTTLKRINLLLEETNHQQLSPNRNILKQFFVGLLFVLTFQFSSLSQDNSPYSRYGLGDLHPNSNILNRGMGGVSAGYSDPNSVNFVNPASYSNFYFTRDRSGRIVLDIGLNIDNRVLRESNEPEKFSSTNTYFSYLQMGIPIKRNWGIAFGLRPITKINYKIERRERLFDPGTGLPIDSAATEFFGDGGANLVSLGTGFGSNNLKIGFNFGYLFGKKDYSTRRTLINDSIEYNRSNHQTRTSYGDIYLNAGIQYKMLLKKDSSRYLQLGAYGNLKNDLNSRRDVIRETFSRSIDGADFRLDSVQEQLDVKGEIIYPPAFGAGFVIEQYPSAEKGGWLFGADFNWTGWERYRNYGQIDSVQDNWYLKFGGHIRPQIGKRNYFSRVIYRAGFTIGSDYVKVAKNLPEYGFSLGFGLPVANYNRLSQGQFAVVNLALEYIKRGNDENILKENLFRLSASFSLSDFWFVKRRYD